MEVTEQEQGALATRIISRGGPEVEVLNFHFPWPSWSVRLTIVGEEVKRKMPNIQLNVSLLFEQPAYCTSSDQEQ